MFYISYNGQYDYTFNLRPSKRPLAPTTERNYTAYKIPGRDGELLSFDGTVKDASLTVEYSIAIPAAYVHGNQGLHYCTQYARKWLYGKAGNGKGRLIFSDYQNFFYQVKNVSIGNLIRKTPEVATFNAVFTIDGYEYYASSFDVWTVLTDGSSTAYDSIADISHPLYRIHGSGLTEISIGDRSPVLVNLPDTNPMIIDTDLMIAYREDTGASMSTAITGDYADLWYPGSTAATVHIDGTAEVKVKPRARRRL